MSNVNRHYENLYVDKAFISSEGILDSFGISSIDQNKALLSKEYIKIQRKVLYYVIVLK